MPGGTKCTDIYDDVTSCLPRTDWHSVLPLAINKTNGWSFGKTIGVSTSPSDRQQKKNPVSLSYTPSGTDPFTLCINSNPFKSSIRMNPSWNSVKKIIFCLFTIYIYTHFHQTISFLITFCLNGLIFLKICLVYTDYKTMSPSGHWPETRNIQYFPSSQYVW